MANGKKIFSFFSPAPYQVRGKLQPESSVSWGYNNLDPGFHRGDGYSAIFS